MLKYKRCLIKICLVLGLCLMHPVLFASDKNYVLQRQQRLTELLAQLVAMDTTTSNQAGNVQALEWVEKHLQPLGLKSKFYQFNGYSSLVITTRETYTPALWLVAHMDVVPGSARLFEPRVEGHKMYGRGTYDMKMAIACYILLMEELVGQLEQYSIGLMLTSDEEIGGMNGVRCLLEEGYRSQVALLPDGGFNWNFEQEAKGVLHIKMISKGVSAHGSRPWLGENAIEGLMDALSGVNGYFEKKQDTDYYSTVNIGTICGGTKINQVPDYAQAELDIRFPSTTSSEQIYSDLETLLQNYPQVSVEKIIAASSHCEDLQNPYFQKFKEIAQQLYGIDIGTMRSHGSSDARFFGEKHIPTLVITPKGGEIHSEGEWVDLEDLTRFYEVMKYWIQSLFFEHAPCNMG